MNWYYAGGVVSGLLAIVCIGGSIMIVWSCKEITIGENTGRFIAAAFALLAYWALPAAEWLPSPSNQFLNWAAPAVAGCLAVFYLVQVFLNYEDEFQAFFDQNVRALVAAALLVGCRVLFWLAEEAFKRAAA